MTKRIPAFPKFKHLDLEDQAEIDEFTRQFPPYSDFNFVSLFCYDTAGDCQVSFLNGNLVVRFRDYVTLEPFFSFLGNNRVADTIERLVLHATAQNIAPLLRLVPESCIRGELDELKDSFTISEDPDSADYIIDAASLVGLASGLWKRKRKAANRFKRANPHHTLARLDLETAETQAQIKRLFRTWAEKREKTHEETQNEFKAIERLLQHARHFRLVSLGAFVDGRLEGFTFNEVVHDGHYMGHFGKTNPDCTGLAVVLESETARVMQSLDCKFMNYQQDLGLDGLKRHKSSWHPTAHLKKYSLRQMAEAPKVVS